jgi:hypothetical protein
MKRFLIGITSFVIFSTSMLGQKATVQVFEDAKISDLVKIKSNLDLDHKIKEGFTIQLYYGERQEAENIIKNYRKNYTEWTATIEYETPNYKVWVGNFMTRLEADRALLKIQKQFPNAFVFRPERKERN